MNNFSFQKTSITLVGAGGVGANTAFFLKKILPDAQLKIIDRDYIDKHNLPRQSVYDQSDLGKPKAIAVAEKLGISGSFEELTSKNADKLLANSTIILDCTDNYATRKIIDNYCTKTKTPWIFASAIRNEAMLTTITNETIPFTNWAKAKKPRSCTLEGISPLATKAIGEEQAEEAKRLLEGQPKYAGRLLYLDTKNGLRVEKPLSEQPSEQDEPTSEEGLTVCSENEYVFTGRFSTRGHANTRLGPASRTKIGKAVLTLIGDKLFIKGVTKSEAKKIVKKCQEAKQI